MIGGRDKGRAIHWAEAFALSAALHVGLIFFAFDFISEIRLRAEQAEELPDLLVTSLVLDADTLAAATQVAPETAPGAIEPDDAEAVDPIEPEETLSGTDEEPEPAPDATPEPTPEEVTELEPETPDEVEPETETPAEVEPDAETPDQVEPETLAAEEVPELEPEPLAPISAEAGALEPVSPLRPQNDTLAAVAPSAGTTVERLSPTAPAAATTTTVAPRTTTTAEVIAPRNTRPDPPPATPVVRREPPPPGSPEAVVGQLVSRIRERVGDPCLVAVPQQTASGAPELVMLSSSETAFASFSAAVLEGIEPEPGQRGVLIDPRQCAALNYIRENPAYPAFRLTVGLATDELEGQAQLQGAVGRAGGRYVTLLLVDDNGVVQDLNSYLTFTGGEARFDVPLRRDGNPRDTKLLLFAIATDARPQTLDQENGQEADRFFDALRAEVGSNTSIVMIPFDLR